ncbi:hypothetical protein BN8_02486 [Fibrisoma limi BUZ 3]|uniref:Uncharacterized protein n=1 Tax=Fibrisoma limi BUZ 3 TaxID=1185876 RepID=I2GHL9_9BACT|nr:hypothetical protein BN8_02486 [Fibrisoma limi BUZ 3]
MSVSGRTIVRQRTAMQLPTLIPNWKRRLDRLANYLGIVA